MSEREVRIERLVGRRVRDAEGRDVGRIEEMVAEIELHEHGRDYVVRELQVGRYPVLGFVAGTSLGRGLLRTLGRGSGYARYRVPWEAMDLADPERPRIRMRREALVRVE